MDWNTYNNLYLDNIKLYMKKLIAFFYIVITWISIFAYADDFVIIPESWHWSSKSGGSYVESDKVAEEAVKEVSNASAWSLWSKYNEKAKELDDNIGAQIASGIMTWDTLLNYIIYLVRFLSQAGLVVWAMSIIYWWYKYWMQVFWGDASWWKNAVKSAIIWVLIIIFSYWIMKILLWMFIE